MDMEKTPEEIDEEFWGPKRRQHKKGQAKQGQPKQDQPKQAKSETNLKFFLWLVFCVSAFLWIGFKLAFYYPLFGETAGTAADPSKPGQALAAESKKTKQVILIMGSDKRGDEASRSDTMMLAFLDTQQGTVNVLNIPRDTYVHIPSRRDNTKINHAYAYGGVELTLETVEEWLQLEVDHYVDTDFVGFAKLIDALGGITVDVEKRMYYPAEDIDLQAGTQLLDGEQALAYVRYRSDGLGDIGRVERQQKFLPILADRVLSLGTLWKIPKLVGIVKDSVETDLSVAEMLWLANSFKNIDGTSIRTQMVPGEADYMGGGSYWVADEDQLAQVVADFAAGLPAAEEASGDETVTEEEQN